MRDNGTHIRTGGRCRFPLLIACLSLLLPLTLSSGCKNGGDEFRRALRSAAHAPNSKPQKQNKKKNISEAEEETQGAESAEARLARQDSIKSCPQGARLIGAPYPKQLAQWCAATSKDGKEIRHGEYRRRHKNGKLKIKASYKNGKYDGQVETYYPSGERRELTTYSEGLRHGEFGKWNKDGTPQQRGSYASGKKHGEFIWWNRGGKMRERGSYRDDEKSGEWIVYHRNGQVRSVTAWQNGIKHGKDEQYSREGVLLSRGGFAENLPAGPWTTFFKNGQKREEGVYLAGQKHGQWTEYRADGGVKKVTVFDRGTVVGTQEARAGRGQTRQRRRRGGQFGKGDILGAPPPRRQRRAAEPSIKVTPQEEKTEDWEELPTNDAVGWEKL